MSDTLSLSASCFAMFVLRFVWRMRMNTGVTRARPPREPIPGFNEAGGRIASCEEADTRP